MSELESLSYFCDRHDVIPLYIKDTVHSGGQIKLLIFEDDVIEITNTPTDECQTIQNRIDNNNLRYYGIIVFKVKDFQQINNIIQDIDELEYCNMYGFPDFKFLKNSVGKTDLVWVEFYTESG